MVKAYSEKHEKSELDTMVKLREILWLLYAPNRDTKGAHAKTKFEYLPLPGDEKIKQQTVPKFSKKDLANLKALQERLKNA